MVSPCGPAVSGRLRQTRRAAWSLHKLNCQTQLPETPKMLADGEGQCCSNDAQLKIKDHDVTETDLCSKQVGQHCAASSFCIDSCILLVCEVSARTLATEKHRARFNEHVHTWHTAYQSTPLPRTPTPAHSQQIATKALPQEPKH